MITDISGVMLSLKIPYKHCIISDIEILCNCS